MYRREKRHSSHMDKPAQNKHRVTLKASSWIGLLTLKWLACACSRRSRGDGGSLDCSTTWQPDLDHVLDQSSFKFMSLPVQRGRAKRQMCSKCAISVSICSELGNAVHASPTAWPAQVYVALPACMQPYQNLNLFCRLRLSKSGRNRQSLTGCTGTRRAALLEAAAHPLRGCSAPLQLQVVITR